MIILIFSTGPDDSHGAHDLSQVQTLHILNAEENGRLPSHYHKCVTELLNVRTAATKLQIFAQVCKSSPTHAREFAYSLSQRVW